MMRFEDTAIIVFLMAMAIGEYVYGSYVTVDGGPMPIVKRMVNGGEADEPLFVQTSSVR